MKLSKLLLFTSIFLFFSSPFARALSVKAVSLDQLTLLARRIVQATLTDKQVELDQEESGRWVAYYTFDVVECLKWPNGSCPETFTIKQLAQGGSSDGYRTINYGIPEYVLGETYLLFLAGDSEQTGLTSPMGMQQGYYPMAREGGRWVIPGLSSRTTLFKNLENSVPAKAAVIQQLKSGSAPNSNDYEEFKSVIKAILEK